MTSVWVIEDGSYSDYHVVGVFSSKENAEKALAINGIIGEISEWPLDPGIGELNQGLSPWHVVMNYDGEVTSAKKYIEELPLEEPRVYRQHNGSRVIGDVWAEDERHAIKIVNEFRTQAIANGAWLGPVSDKQRCAATAYVVAYNLPDDGTLDMTYDGEMRTFSKEEALRLIVSEVPGIETYWKEWK